MQVTAEDQFNNIATSFTDAIQLASSDSQASVSRDSTPTNGVSTFGVILRTKGSMTITATDSTNPSINDTDSITVDPGQPSQITLTDPTTTAGSLLLLTMTIQDRFNNIETGYSATVTFASSDTGPATRLPPRGTLTGGIGVFSVTLTTAGNQTLTVTDTSSGTSRGPSHVTVAGRRYPLCRSILPSSTTAGNAFVLVVTAQDQFNHTAPGYAGTVPFHQQRFAGQPGCRLHCDVDGRYRILRRYAQDRRQPNSYRHRHGSPASPAPATPSPSVPPPPLTLP